VHALKDYIDTNEKRAVIGASTSAGVPIQFEKEEWQLKAILQLPNTERDKHQGPSAIANNQGIAGSANEDEHLHQTRRLQQPSNRLSGLRMNYHEKFRRQ
jgi:hypothetical protein